MRCQAELGKFCSTWEILPTSYAVPGALSNASAKLISSGDVTDIYEGVLNGSKVCVKRARDPLEQAAQKVHYLTSSDRMVFPDGPHSFFTERQSCGDA